MHVHVYRLSFLRRSGSADVGVEDFAQVGDMAPKGTRRPDAVMPAFDANPLRIRQLIALHHRPPPTENQLERHESHNPFWGNPECRLNLVLADSKTGPRKVPLNAPARRVLERQPKDGSAFVFPSPRNPAEPRSGHLGLWYRIRREAGIEDVRLHDLRHTLASQAVMNGVPVPVVARLLGHSRVSMTLRYAHLRDREVEAAAERVGQYIGSKLDL